MRANYYSAIRFFVLFAFFFSLSGKLYSQDSYMYYSGGYGIAKENLDGLNYVINIYNDKSNVIKGLGTFNTLDGFTVAGGIVFSESILLEAGFTQRDGYTYSDEVDTIAAPYKRELSVRSNTIGFGLGKYLLWQEGFKLLVGSTFEFGKIILLTRYYNTNDASVPGYEDVGQENDQNYENNNTLYAVTPYIQFGYSPWGKQFELVIKSYYQVQLKESDFRYVNQSWNPDTYEQSSSDATKNFANNFGLQLKLNVLIGVSL